MIKYYNHKHLEEERVYFHLQPLHSPLLKGVRAGTQGRSQEAGTEADAGEECCLLTWGHFLNSGSLFSDDSILCQIDKKNPTKTMAIIFVSSGLRERPGAGETAQAP